jgi:hypothetical protein
MIKLLLVFLIVALLMGGCVANGTAKLGDVNADGVITDADYGLVRESILELRTLSSTEQLAADVNKDGAISITDYTMIRLDTLGLKKIN